MTSIKKLQLTPYADGKRASVRLDVTAAGEIEAVGLYITDAEGGAPLTGKIIWES